ncbi:NmrA/HSCARG family protein [Micromonospora sp. NBC_00858]|uniref:NmrA/HSCARG family protein n=1 Tax=Micromonospora sp. NBC_00858 TaxID=2975979 RepID=UPI00386ED33A|nr:NmrA/HSCARG family protein [Micromonospora sp. NBC_00858]
MALTIAVTGATGAQGSGLVRAILADAGREFSVRAITRDISSVRARKLAELGAEVVSADHTTGAGLEEAFADVHGAFLVTDFWSHMSAAREPDQARNLAEATAKAGVRHVIWSTLEDTRIHVPVDDPRMPSLQEKYKIPHFDAKAEAEAFFHQAGVPVTFLRTTFQFENLTAGMAPVRTPEGLILTMPIGDSPIAGIAASDSGKVALEIFRRRDEFVGRTLSIAGDIVTGAEIASALSDALHEPVVYRPIGHDDFRALGFPAADEVGNMLGTAPGLVDSQG